MSQQEEIKEVADALYRCVSLGAECEQCGFDDERHGDDSDKERLTFAAELYGFGWRHRERLLCASCVKKAGPSNKGP